MPDSPPKVFITLPDGTKRSLDEAERKARDEYFRDHGEIMATWHQLQKDWMRRDKK